MHPTLKLMLLIVLAAAVQLMSLNTLALTGMLLIGLALYWHIALLKKIIYRSRWLLLTMLLIYAFTTPGEYLPGWESYALTYEGLAQGTAQAARLVIMLSGLALLLGTTHRDDLMAGIYWLINPLRYLGVSPDRFTARLWLTLHYVEQENPRSTLPFWRRFEAAAAMAEEAAIDRVSFTLPAFKLQDWAVLTATLLAVFAWSMM